MDVLHDGLTRLNSFLWGALFLIPLLCGTGLFYTLRLRFVQVRKFAACLGQVTKSASHPGIKGKGMSSFQALTTAIAAQVGTGNVAGTATAIVLGGPGALFWLWLAAFFGMATIFAEAVLAQVYKSVDPDGVPVGGPAWYIIRGLGRKARPLAIFFSISLIFALGFIGNMVQTNTIAEAFHGAFDIPPLASGIFTAVLAAAVFMGGMKSIASVTEKLVPGMAALYLAGGSFVLIQNWRELLPAFGLIFSGAFSTEGIIGGAVGITFREAMRYGIARGLFANEAGMGSTPHAHAVAKVSHPCEQGLVAIFGVFTTLVIITFTGLVLLTSGVAISGNPETGIRLTQSAYSMTMGDNGGKFVAICLFFFAFSTIIGWYFFGAQNVRFLFRGKGVNIYCLMVLCFIILGSQLQVNLVWQCADLFNGLMIIPNLIALWGLHKVVEKKLREYEKIEMGKRQKDRP